MATGDQQDMHTRLRALMPKRWLPVNAPNEDAKLSGPAWALSTVYAQITYTALQTRIKTATDGWLDVISYDFFGDALPRLTNEGDGPFRARILANLFVKGPTRQCMVNVLQLLTGKAPTIFEPGNASDSGGWDAMYWDMTGGWGDYLPFQAFVTVYRPDTSLVSLGEWDAWRFAWDAYGAWSDSSPNAITDAALIAAVESTRALSTVVWMRIADAPLIKPSISFAPLGQFVLVESTLGVTQNPV